MATRKQRQEQKITFLLFSSHLSLGELQSHATVQRVVKQGRKPPAGLGEQSIDRRPIVRRPHLIKGTRIPASTLKCFQDGTKTPRKRSIKKLLTMYENLQYNRLRASGVNKQDAKRIKHYEPDAVQTTISNYLRNAGKIQSNYEKKYHQDIKDYERQEREKLHPPEPKPLKPPKPPPKPPKQKPVPEDRFYEEILERPEKPLEPRAFVYPEEEMFLEPDTEEEMEREREEVQFELKEPVKDDYPSLDEVIFGMSESKHLESEWDDIADTSGLKK